MRISDWSSDVCSSDLRSRLHTWMQWPRSPGGNLQEPPWHRLPPPSTTCLPHPLRNASPLPCIRPRLRSAAKIGRASCRERVCQTVYIQVVSVSYKKKKNLYISNAHRKPKRKII